MVNVSAGHKKDVENLIKVLDECMEKPSFFAKTFLKVDLFPYQVDYVDCRDRFIVCRWNRQAGKTLSTAIKTIHFAWFADYLHELIKTEAERTNQAIANIVIVAPTQNQANIMFGRIRDLIHTSDILEQYIVREKSDEIHIKFASGRGVTKVFTRAAGDKGTSLRGYSPSIIIADECAFLKEEVLSAFLPSGVATHARIWLTSTPFSPVGFFYDACMDSRPRKPDGKWREFHVKAQQNPLIQKDPEYFEQLKSKMTRDRQMMELEAEFLDVGDSFIPRQLIIDAMSDNSHSGIQPVIIKYYMGVDVSRAGKDETAFIIIGVDSNDNCYLVTTYTESLSNIVDLKDKIAQYIKMYNIQTCYIDETGVGAGLVDLCMKENLPIRGVVFSLEEQESLYENLRLLFENHRIYLRGERRVADQLAYLKIKFTEGNKMRVVSEQADDLADALTLACKAVESGGRVFLLPSSKAIFG